MFEKRVVHGVPLVRINAIQDAAQIRLPAAKHVVETTTQFFGRDFARIARADGRDDVGKNNSGLEAIEQTVELNSVHVKIVRWQIGEGILAGTEQSLIRQVVDGQAGSRRSPPPFPLFLVSNQKRNQSHLPVVDVYQFWLPRQIT